MADTTDNRKPRWRRWLVIAVVVVVGIAASFGWSYWRSQSLLSATHEVEVEAIDIPEDIEYGRYLAHHVLRCADCHGADLGGALLFDSGAMGVAYAPNITPGAGSVVAGYTVRDWVRTLRHGVARDGRGLLLMPCEDYDGWPRHELGVVIGYLQSLPPVDRESRACEPGPIMRGLLASGRMRLAPDKVQIPDTWPQAERGPTAAWGEMLVGVCTGCHGPGLSGGKIPEAKRDAPDAANISPHADGLGGWSYADFETAMTEGKTPDGRVLREPMPWRAYAGLEDVELQAMWAYLQTVPAQPTGGR